MLRASLLVVAVFCQVSAVSAQEATSGSETGALSEQRILHVKPRYYRWHVDVGEEWLEKNTGYACLEWDIPMSQAALVLVDVWDRHYLKEPEDRAERIIQETIRPLLKTCRTAGLQIIHAPSPSQAQKCAAWVGREKQKELPAGAPIPKTASVSAKPWPPAQFRGKSGPYAKYARPAEPMASDRLRILKGLCLHPDVQPEGADVVVATGQELHEFCRDRGILFLFYLGFNTNMCILQRDYGTMAMHTRGYEIIVVRDCTTGMESFETQDGLWQTRGAILFLEMNRKYSILSKELLAGLPKQD
ncbi:MAG: isochorismatase family protein [Planctomycetes bacterium]|nr:isochorismatase family protein [Planctomycetota bacterium]MBL7038067.1 isochorismatase family protein [Pirellulaceae bacterium]